MIFLGIVNVLSGDNNTGAEHRGTCRFCPVAGEWLTKSPVSVRIWKGRTGHQGHKGLQCFKECSRDVEKAAMKTGKTNHFSLEIFISPIRKQMQRVAFVEMRTYREGVSSWKSGVTVNAVSSMLKTREGMVQCRRSPWGYFQSISIIIERWQHCI